MNLFITGGAGFIGSHLAQRFLALKCTEYFKRAEYHRNSDKRVIKGLSAPPKARPSAL